MIVVLSCKCSERRTLLYIFNKLEYKLFLQRLGETGWEFSKNSLSQSKKHIYLFFSKKEI